MFDGVEIYDGPYIAGVTNATARLCGNYTGRERFLMKSRNFVIRFYSDRTVAKRGFRAGVSTALGE